MGQRTGRKGRDETSGGESDLSAAGPKPPRRGSEKRSSPRPEAQEAASDPGHETERQLRILLEERADRLARMNTLVRELSQVLAARTIDDLLQKVCDAAREVTRARVAVAGHGFRDGVFRVGAASKVSAGADCPPGHVFSVERGGVHRVILDTCRPLRLTDAELHRHPDWWGLPPGHAPLRGLLGVPLTGLDGLASGMIMVSDRSTGGDFTEEDEALLSEIGLVASLGLRHIEARTEVEQRVCQLDAAKREVEEANRRKDEFLATLSHELRNPLAPIRNCLYLLGREAPSSPRASRALEVIERQANHLSRLVDDLLDVTRISRGKVELKRRRLDLGRLVQATLDDHRSVLALAGLEPQLGQSAEPLWVDGDATRLAQVVGNLLLNAAKFTPAGGHVSITLERQGARARLRVADDGVGIDAETLPRLFQPFVQAGADLARSRGGLGLGLALVKGLVQLHGGRVEARSAGRAAGAEFVVELPLASSGPEEPLRPPAHGAARGRRVLIIEDNRDAAASLGEALRLGGHVVELAHDGHSGIEAARAFLPEIVLCDIGLPRMDGYEVARSLRSEAALRSAFLVALTGYALPDDLRRAAEAGFDHHLAKPAELDALEHLLASFEGKPTP